ncbi:DUF3265 domain-containing protein [Vibrio parahaemolyticus]|nr:DUF3265 domain-containing protein [Vibrio parahaemolyticus]TOK33155.1 hypothetical protein CGI21_24630 [Vibrio parahaemolyticus]
MYQRLFQKFNYNRYVKLCEWQIHSYHHQSHSKQFKRDSARVAFLVCVGFCVEVPCRSFGIACFTP